MTKKLCKKCNNQIGERFIHSGYCGKHQNQIVVGGFDMAEMTKQWKQDDDQLAYEEAQIKYVEDQIDKEWDKRVAEGSEKLANLPDYVAPDVLPFGDETNLKIYLEAHDIYTDMHDFFGAGSDAVVMVDIEDEAGDGESLESVSIEDLERELQEYAAYAQNGSYAENDHESGALKLVVYEAEPDEGGYSRGELLWHQPVEDNIKLTLG